MEANGRPQGGEGPCSWIWTKLRRHWWLLLTLAAVMLFLDIETGKMRAQVVARSSQETVRKVLDGLQQQIGFDKLQRPRNGSLATEEELVKLFSNIDNELWPWRKRGITLEGVERAYCSFAEEGFRLQVINGTGYVVGDVGSWQHRGHTLRSQVGDVIVEEAVPDIDIYFTTSDFCKERDRSFRKAKEEGDSPCKDHLVGPVVSQDRHEGEDQCITAPDFSWGGWPEVYLPKWEETRELILASAAKQPWEKRVSKLFWRGARTNDMRARVANEIAPRHEDLMDVRIMDHGNHDSFISLDEHCKYKYLLHMAGRTYSSHLKWILLCGSPVIFPREEEPHSEFWYHMLQDGHNFVAAPPVNGDGGFLIDRLEALMADDTYARGIAANGVHLASEILHPDNIHRYWLELFKRYAALQSFKPTLHPDAVPLVKTLLRPTDHVIKFEDRTCSVC